MRLSEAKSIHVAGHRGMVGAALVRALQGRGSHQLLTPTREELDLSDAQAVENYYAHHKPDVAIIAAAKVGGIHANNTYPAHFLHENLAIAHNTIHGAWMAGVPRLLFLGSSCIYPREAPQPIPEDALLTDPLEPTNEAYAVAKITGLKLCQYYRQQYGVLYHSAMPANLYGPGDNYHPENSHVLPALIRRFHEAKTQNYSTVTIWGTGNPRREFLYVEDLAHGILHLLEHNNPPDWINLGTGEDLTIRELAETIAKIVGFDGKIQHDTSRPDGMMRKKLDTTRINELGWHAHTSLEEGIRMAYEDFRQGNFRE